LAVGRDLRTIAAIQQRFIESQQQLERDYWRRRQAEARYRQLFQVATDAVLVVDALSHLVVEANRAAAQMFATAPGAFAGHAASAGFSAAARRAVDDLLNTAHTQARAVEIRVRSDGKPLSVSAAPFQADGVPLLLLRIRAADMNEASGDELTRLIELVERTPDAIVVTDTGGRIRTANPAFQVLCNLQPDAELSGRLLSEWIGTGSREVHELLETVRRQGIAAPVVTRMRGVDSTVDVEITAVLLPEGDQDSIGFTMRRRIPRSAEDGAVFDELSRAVERLATRLGSLRLPTLMREGADIVERHLLQAALARATNDEAAAQLLGISEESLVLRLRRHGIRPGGNLAGTAS
jgi:transcriptional regulator PpsR